TYENIEEWRAATGQKPPPTLEEWQALNPEGTKEEYLREIAGTAIGGLFPGAKPAPTEEPTPTVPEQIEEMPPVPTPEAPELAPAPEVTPAPEFEAPEVPEIPGVTPAPAILDHLLKYISPI
ncbi:unnamed protein product, partial [marine sediment metagenome]